MPVPTESTIRSLIEALQKLIGLHRDLLALVRSEKEALVSADLKTIQECTYAKEVLINSIHQQDKERLRLTSMLAMVWKKPLEEMTLMNIVIRVQGDDIKTAERLQSVYTTLALMIKRIDEQNKENQVLVEHSLKHIAEMKKNVLGESEPLTNTYSQKGTKISGAGASRIFSEEA